VIPFQRTPHPGQQIRRASPHVRHIGDLGDRVRRGKRQVLVGQALENQKMLILYSQGDEKANLSINKYTWSFSNIDLSSTQSIKYYIYYDIAMTYYLLENETQAIEYVNKTKLLQIDNKTKSSIRTLLYSQAMYLQKTQPRYINQSIKFQNMLNSSANVTTYINNYLVPFVNRYKTNPYLWSIDICNEIEWIYENGASSGGGYWTGATYPILQRFVAMCAAGIHNNPRTDGTTVLATVGSASVKWNGATEVQETSSGPGTSGANSTGNKWSDANLMAQNGNVANGILDFYSPHYYGWMEQYYSSPFENTPAAFGMSEKPCVVGEMPSMSPVATDISGYPITTMTLTTAFNNLQSKGWQGHQPWTANLTSNLTAEVGDLANFGSFAFAFYNANKTLVKPSCSTCATVAPTVSTPVTYCQNATASALTATGTSLLWYTVSSGGTGSSTAPTPTTTAAGSTSYYVSQTLNGCEGSRAAITVTVNALPTVSAGSNVSICTGKSTVLTATGGTSYKWSNSITTAANTVSPTVTTTYSVTGTNANGCSATASAIVTVNSIPTVTLTASSGSICNGASSVLTAAGATTYAWSSGTANPQTVSPTATTTYTVTGTTNGCNGIASTTVTVTVVPSAPNVTSPISYTTSATATALTASGTNLSWYSVASGGTGSSTAPIPSTANVGSTNYYVSQTINTCESPRAIIVVNVSQVNVTQTISLSQGWNIVSFNVLPTDSTVATIFGTLGTTLLTVKDQDGFYDPSQSSIFNSLLTISKSKGYLVDVSQVATLSVVGVPLNTASINLSSGWNLIGYPKQASTAISSELSGIWTPFVSIKNFDGFYQKGGTLNSLTNFVPGLGYFINVSSSCTLNY